MNNSEILQSHNTRLGKNNTDLSSILNVVNNLPSRPKGTIDITANGEYDIKEYVSANVNVPKDTTIEDAIINRTIEGNYENDRITNIGEYAFYMSKNLTEAKFSNVTTVSNFAFNQCSALLTAEFPEATTIGNSVFYGSPLTTLYAPKVTKVGNYGCQGTRLAEVILPSLETASMCSWYRCYYLTKCYLPKLSNFITNAFGDCSNLEAFIIEREDKVCAMGNTNVFANSGIANGTGYVYVPDSLVESYKTATNWSTYASQIKGLSEMPDELKQWVEEAKANGN
jgi:hypothetical protein